MKNLLLLLSLMLIFSCKKEEAIVESKEYTVEYYSNIFIYDKMVKNNMTKEEAIDFYLKLPCNDFTYSCFLYSINDDIKRYSLSVYSLDPTCKVPSPVQDNRKSYSKITGAELNILSNYYNCLDTTICYTCNIVAVPK